MQKNFAQIRVHKRRPIAFSQIYCVMQLFRSVVLAHLNSDRQTSVCCVIAGRINRQFPKEAAGWIKCVGGPDLARGPQVVYNLFNPLLHGKVSFFTLLSIFLK